MKFNPKFGLEENFEPIKRSNPNLVQVKDIWMDPTTGDAYFIIEDNIVDFSNNLLYNNYIKKENHF